MLDLCNELKISLDELLSGEMISVGNKKQEQFLIEMTKQIEQKNIIIWASMWGILAVSIIGLMIGVFIAAFLMPEGIVQLITILGICIVFLIPCFYALKLEVSVGSYKCKKCGYEIMPTYSEALWAMHRGVTCHLKCPKCNKRTWCKKGN